MIDGVNPCQSWQIEYRELIDIIRDMDYFSFIVWMELEITAALLWRNASGYDSSFSRADDRGDGGDLANAVACDGG